MSLKGTDGDDDDAGLGSFEQFTMDLQRKEQARLEQQSKNRKGTDSPVAGTRREGARADARAQMNGFRFGGRPGPASDGDRGQTQASGSSVSGGGPQGHGHTQRAAVVT